VPARVHGTKDSGGRIELLLERVLTATTALVHARSSKSLKMHSRCSCRAATDARMLGREGDLFRLEFSGDVLAFFESPRRSSAAALHRPRARGADRERYQTVYARAPGAVAAPTAGLHFDAALFAALEKRG
jgi:S-adenosylmethionine:tRNA ribosyltransferase-isomerase